MTTTAHQTPHVSSLAGHEDWLTWFAGSIDTWLPPDLPAATTLSSALSAATPTAPIASRTAAESVILFPLLYTDTPRVTSAAFHQLVDACSEAQRCGGSVAVTGFAVGRSAPTSEADRVIAKIARVMADAGWPTRAYESVFETSGAGVRLASRARATSYTRRRVDLPDLLIAAASDLLGAHRVYLSEGTAPGRHLGRVPCVPPLTRLHAPGQPFAPPPPYAKRAPAGSDQVWAAACTLAVTDLPTVPRGQRAELEHEVRRRVEPSWRTLQGLGLTAHYGPAHGDRRRVVAFGPRRRRICVPLFGAPVPPAAARSLLSVAATVGQASAVVDDLTPHALYQEYDAEQTRDRYRALAAELDADVHFLSDTEPAQFAHQVEEALRTLTVADLEKASPPGRGQRLRAGFTGYDALHLAVMTVACRRMPTAAIAVQAANAPAVQAITRAREGVSVLSRSGPPGPVDEHEFRLGASWLPARLGDSDPR